MNQHLPFRWLGPLLFGWLMGCAIPSPVDGCAIPSPVDDPIQDAHFQGPPLAAVRAQPEAFLQKPVRWGGLIARVDNQRAETLQRPVRWGGLIARVDNQREETTLEIVEQPLDERGRPVADDESGGRFFARIPGFLDPAIYAVGRSIRPDSQLSGPGDLRRGAVDHRRGPPDRYDAGSGRRLSRYLSSGDRGASPTLAGAPGARGDLRPGPLWIQPVLSMGLPAGVLVAVADPSSPRVRRLRREAKT